MATFAARLRSNVANIVFMDGSCKRLGDQGVLHFAYIDDRSVLHCNADPLIGTAVGIVAGGAGKYKIVQRIARQTRDL